MNANPLKRMSCIKDFIFLPPGKEELFEQFVRCVWLEAAKSAD
jgi:hypothetical protein